MQYAIEYGFAVPYTRPYSFCMNTPEAIGHRLDEAMRDASFRSQNALSKKSGVPQPTISRILKGAGEKGPETETLRKLAAACEVSFTWLHEGIGPKQRHSGFGNSPINEQDALEAIAEMAKYDSDEDRRQALRRQVDLALAPKPDEVLIPQYDAGGSMGNGLILDGMAGVIKSWRVDQEWLRLNVRSHTGTANLCIVTGFGPSMRPMFNPGDPLLLDRGVNTFDREDAVYFFRIGNHGYIKTVQRIPQLGGGMIYRAKSKNPDYDPFEIIEGMDFEVFGKVLTVWKSEQF